MARIGILLVFLFALALIGAGLYLAYGTFPVPTTQVEKVVPNDRFAK
jgi:hypothetical protein